MACSDFSHIAPAVYEFVAPQSVTKRGKEYDCI